MLIHASCVAIEGKGVLIAGPAGAGKSDLALRLIDSGARLVADDQTELRLENGTLIASPPTAIAGLFEVRHCGLVRMPYRNEAPVALYVDLSPPNGKLERMPEVESIDLLGHPIQLLRLSAFAASTPAKIHAMLLYPLVSGRA